MTEPAATTSPPDAPPSELVASDPSTEGAVTPPTSGFSWKKLLWVSWPLGIVVVLVAFGVPICPTKNFLGIPCPGCGMTRATEAMLTGDLMGVLRYHPLAPIVTPIVVYSAIRTLLISAGGIPVTSKDPLSRFPKWFWTLLLVSVVGLWVARFAGAFGGLPDPVEPTQGWIYRGGRFLFYDLWQ
ncbi:MAG: DUF2752 domain-containing protein [Sandaracinaceae bacterium]